MTEFLEHVERDLDVLRRVRAGASVIATVPSFPAAGHVRHFKSAGDVAGRYSTVLNTLDVSAIRRNSGGSIYFVLQGTR